MREVNARLKPGGDQLVLTKFFPIIYRYGVHHGRERR